MRRRTAGLAGLFLLVGCLTAFPSPGQAFRYVEMGEVLKNPTLPTLGGGQASLLSADAKANVFVFFRPNQDHSQKALAELAGLERELAGKPVRYVVIVSGRFDEAEVRAVVDPLGLSAPVLVDEGDALFGRLGVSLHPVAGVANGNFELTAYQPYNNLRFTPLVRAQVRHLLGELSDDELARTLSPPPSAVSTEAAVARRNLRFAEKLLERGKHETALERARKAVGLHPEFPEGHALVGAILAAMGDCKAAVEAFEQALTLDADNDRARKGREDCHGKS